MLAADAAGHPGRPAVVFCHRFASSRTVFDLLFDDEVLQREFYMAS
jgi:hypothetical protein